VNVSEETIASYSYSMSPLIRLDSWSKEQNGVTHGSATSAHLTPYKNDYINDNLSLAMPLECTEIRQECQLRGYIGNHKTCKMDNIIKETLIN